MVVNLGWVVAQKGLEFPQLLSLMWTVMIWAVGSDMGTMFITPKIYYYQRYLVSTSDQDGSNLSMVSNSLG